MLCVVCVCCPEQANSFRNMQQILAFNEQMLGVSVGLRSDVRKGADAMTAHLRRLRDRQFRLLQGHEGLTPHERDILVEQRRLALSSTRAKVCGCVWSGAPACVTLIRVVRAGDGDGAVLAGCCVPTLATNRRRHVPGWCRQRACLW